MNAAQAIPEGHAADNEIRVATNSFIEIYNAGTSEVDLSNWTLTEHPIAAPIFSTVKIPAGTKLAYTQLTEPFMLYINVALIAEPLPLTADAGAWRP